MSTLPNERGELMGHGLRWLRWLLGCSLLASSSIGASSALGQNTYAQFAPSPQVPELPPSQEEILPDR
jgi:hypothetical protein